ncbi:Alpha/beta hydrolase fold [Trema orientale]|uniref:Alpha/beta hydrolase fold n=1 Tax=Trema orientale TaxID=63057 RepID=A0A2P5ER97_TREOI|nr:Alpha/beta hydrolase fold [Trema orientale]
MSDHHQEHENQLPICTVDPYDYLKIILNPDATITRNLLLPSTPATPDPNSDLLSPVLTKDVTLNPTRNTWIRIFLPSKTLDNNNYSSSTVNNKLPLIVYYHGGGLILMSASSSLNHDFCSQMAAELSAVVVSVDYRLAPEHRLPAAYEDAVEALDWIKSTDEIWLRGFADVSKCFLMGTSAGGNIAYHAGLRASAAVDDLAPLRIRGLILHHPFFGGVRRTDSEVRLVNDPGLPLSGTDLMWELALPIGFDRDHKYCNPTADDGLPDTCDQIKRLGWRLLVIGCDGDPLIDRQVALADMLKKNGVQVIPQFSQGNYHGVELLDISKAKSLFVLLKDLINDN